MRAIRWPPNIIRWMIDLRHAGGSAAINLMRGIGGVTQGSAGKLTYNSRSFNLYLPSLSTLKAYLEPLDLHFGIDMRQIAQLSQQIHRSPLLFSKHVGVKFDEVCVKKGLIYKGDQVIGTMKGVVMLGDAAELTAEDLGTQVSHFFSSLFIFSSVFSPPPRPQMLLVMVTTLDGKLQRYIGMFVTCTADADQLQAILNDVEAALRSHGLSMPYLSADCAASNLSVFHAYEERGRCISHPDSGHLLKNIRNSVLTGGTMFFTDASGRAKWISIDPIRSHRFTHFSFLGGNVIDPGADKQKVRFCSISMTACLYGFLTSPALL